MTTILGIPGSLRKASYNAALLRAAVELAPPGSTLEVASLAGIPLYDGDLEQSQGVPASVTQLKERIVASAGLILATPEYNSSLPGVFKNAVDWLSRPGSDIPRVFGKRPVAVIGATPGRGGTILAQSAWLPVLRTFGALPWFGGRLMVSNAAQVFDESGRLTDEQLRKQVADFMAGFADFIGRVR